MPEEEVTTRKSSFSSFGGNYESFVTKSGKNFA